MRLATLYENKNLEIAMKAIRRGKVTPVRITQAAREYSIPPGMIGSALSNHVHNNYDLFYGWWKNYKGSVDWPQYKQMMLSELPAFNRRDTPLDNLDPKFVEPPAPPTSSAFQSPPSKHMNRG